MILSALNDCYSLLLNDPDSGVAPPGYSRAGCSFALVLSEKGEVKRVYDLRDKKKSILQIVPFQKNRPGKSLLPYFLCDKSKYLLGFEYDKKLKKTIITADSFRSAKDLHLDLLSGIEDNGAKAVVNFFEINLPELAANIPVIADKLEDIGVGGLILFRLEGEKGYINERPAIKAKWEEHINEGSKKDEIIGQCLVTGETGRVATTHNLIKGVWGAQSAGASLVGVNIKSAESFGREQAYNSPVSDDTVFRYTTALNYLLASEKNRLQIGDASTVFWAQRSVSGMEVSLLSMLLGTNEKEEDRTEQDWHTENIMKTILLRIKLGQLVEDYTTEVDHNTKMYILGLSPNAGRISARFWHVNTFGEIVKKISQHYTDMEIIRSERDREYIPIKHILTSIAVLGKYENIPPLLEGTLIRSIFEGLPYPPALYSMLLSRIRANSEIGYIRAAIVKAYLLRYFRYNNYKNKEEEITVGLNENSNNTAYNLGRLFAVMEKTQQDANGSSNIRERYFAAASTTPKGVFPTLLNLAQHHIAKSDWGYNSDKRIEEILGRVDAFPANLSLEEQGMFILGYYHQRQSFFLKSKEA